MNSDSSVSYTEAKDMIETALRKANDQSFKLVEELRKEVANLQYRVSQLEYEKGKNYGF